MKLIKIAWVMRAMCYKPFFGHIGRKCYIGKPCFIRGSKHIHLGRFTRIFPGVRMEAFDGGEIVTGSNVAIQQNVHITSAKSKLIIEDDVAILANTYITNIDHNYQDIEKAVLDQGYEVKETRIGKGCFIGSGAAIQAGTILGKHCVVGAHAVVRGEFPDYCVIVGAPAKIVKRYNEKTKKWEKQ